MTTIIRLKEKLPQSRKTKSVTMPVHVYVSVPQCQVLAGAAISSSGGGAVTGLMR